MERTKRQNEADFKGYQYIKWPLLKCKWYLIIIYMADNKISMGSSYGIYTKWLLLL
jgi:hypothetical protein